MFGSSEFALSNVPLREIKVKDYTLVVVNFLTNRLEIIKVQF